MIVMLISAVVFILCFVCIKIKYNNERKTYKSNLAHFLLTQMSPWAYLLTLSISSWTFMGTLFIKIWRLFH